AIVFHRSGGAIEFSSQSPANQISVTSNDLRQGLCIMNPRKRLLCSALVASALGAISAGSCSASTYEWSWSGAVSGSGSLTTDVPGSCVGGGLNCELITSINGTFLGTAFDSLTLPPSGSNDNELFPASSPQLDVLGFSFELVPGMDINIGFDGGT